MSKVQRLDTPYGRVYVYQSEEGPVFMPSVTTILSSEPSPYLEDLESKIGKEKLAEIGERAAGRGTAMHKFLENYVICIKNGGSADLCLLYTQKKTLEDLRGDNTSEDRIAYGRDLFYNFIHQETFSRVNKVLFTEKFLWSLNHMFAGTTDFGFLDLEDRIIIADFKSASGIRGEEVVSKYKKQLAAYTLAFEERNKKKRVKEAQIWISHPDGVQMEKMLEDEIQEKKDEFIKLAQSFHQNWDKSLFQEYYQTYESKSNT